MADWNTPASLSTAYATVLTNLKDRDTDAITLQVSAPSNLPTGAIKWNRALNKFQEWDGAVFQDMIVALAGGGTGSATAAGARTNLGLGTMAVQSSSAVAITGGTITGVTIDASVITSGVIALARGGTGASLALGASGSVLQSNGAAVVFGTDGSALINLNATQLTSGTLPNARFPAVLPAIDGSALTNLPVQLPPGCILPYGASAAPTGYLLCDGSAVNRTTYAALFAIVATTYGVGDGSTTFNLPDLRQRFPLGKATAGTGSTLGGVGGAIDHIHTVPIDGYGTAGSPVSGRIITSDGAGGVISPYAVSNSSPNSGLNNPPFQVVTYIIKT